MEAILEQRRFPKAKLEWMRVQVGRMETRELMEPIYGGHVGHTLCGHKRSQETGAVFRLLGYGETLEEAEAMAKAKTIVPVSPRPVDTRPSLKAIAQPPVNLLRL
jgi:hypothetical protein